MEIISELLSQKWSGSNIQIFDDLSPQKYCKQAHIYSLEVTQTYLQSWQKVKMKLLNFIFLAVIDANQLSNQNVS